MSWATWSSDWFDSQKSRGLSPTTVTMRAGWLRRFIAYCDRVGLSGPQAVTLQDVLRFGKALRYTKKPGRRVYAPASRVVALSAVRAFFRWALQTRRLLVDPTAELRLARTAPASPVLLTVRQVADLCAKQGPETPLEMRDRAIIETLYSTAIRLSECTALDLTDVNVRDGWLRIRHPKGKTHRLVPIGPHLAAVLIQYLAEGRPQLEDGPGHPALFLSRHGQRLGSAAVRVRIAEAGLRLGIRRLHPHALRRACATHLLAAGAPLEDIQPLMGHGHLATTGLYTEVAFSTLKAEHTRTHPQA